MGQDNYRGGATYYHPVSDNIDNVTQYYLLRDGYFGTKGLGRKGIRHISGDDPLKMANDFYSKLAYGGVERKLTNGKGVITKMQDGLLVCKREVSSSDGTPVVEINIEDSSNPAGIKNQKIHFVRSKNENRK